MTRLKTVYTNEIIPKLKEELGINNVNAIPKITKITLNMGVGDALGDKKVMTFAVADMEAISGQKVVVTNARKSVAGFKVRQGWPVGCKVTLRKDRMYEFLDRLINIAIPRERDFRGLNPKSFDGQGNFAMGIKEQIIFPEVAPASHCEHLQHRRAVPLPRTGQLCGQQGWGRRPDSGAGKRTGPHIDLEA